MTAAAKSAILRPRALWPEGVTMKPRWLAVVMPAACLSTLAQAQVQSRRVFVNGLRQTDTLVAQFARLRCEDIRGARP